MMEEQSSADSSTIKQKFHLQNSKLQTYVDNAIKKSHVKQFVNKKSKVSQNLITQSNSQNRNLNEHLFNLKNSCNGIVKDINNKENQSVKLKDQTLFTSQKVKQLQTQRQKLQQKIKKLTSDTENVQIKKQTTLYTYKTYQNILTRMKKDQIINQIKTNALQKQLQTMQKQIKQLENKEYSLKQFQQLSLRGLKQAEIQILQSSQIRQKKVTQISNTLEGKKVVQIKKLQRQNQTQSIQQMAAGDLQDADLIRIKRFLQVQIFLKFLLKSKMQILKNKYEPFQLAFMQIKSQTCVKDAASLKTQFYNFQQNYQQRTAWIKRLEQQIVHLQADRKQIQNDFLRVKQSQLDLYQQYQDKNNKKNHQDNQQIQNKNLFNTNYINHELTIMKVKQWVNYQFKIVNLNNSKISFTNLKPSCKNIIVTHDNTLNHANFKKICDYLLSKKQITQKIQKQDLLIFNEKQIEKSPKNIIKTQQKNEIVKEQKNEVRTQK